MLLETKFLAPTTQLALMRRDRLLARLGQPQGGAMTLLHAPPGYGKTTLVSQWLNRLDNTCVWLSLDERDNDELRFWSYLVGAFLNSNPNLFSASQQLLEQKATDQTDLLLTAFVNDLFVLAKHAEQDGQVLSVSNPLLLVLDDYHFIQNDSINTGFNYFLDNLPPFVHVVLTSRVLPPLSISRRRVRRLLNEITSKDLAFLKNESKQYFTEVLDQELTDENLEILQQRTEGWPAALQLAAVSMQEASNLQSAERVFSNAVNGLDELAIGYLFDEVISLLDPLLQTFAVNASLLSCFSAELLDAMFGIKNSSDLINRLREKNLFVLPLDSDGRWYRFHELFRQALRSHFESKDKEEQFELHLHAGRTLESFALKQEAIDHYLAAEAWQEASNLIEDLGYNRALTSEDSMIVAWLEMLPREVLNLRPKLMLVRAWAFFRSSDVTPAESYLNQIEKLLRDGHAPAKEEERQKLLSQVALYKTQLARIVGDNKAIEHWSSEFNNYMQHQPEELDPVALIGVVLDHYFRGEMADTVDIASRALRTAKKEGNQFLALTLSQMLAAAALYSGQIKKGFNVLEEIKSWIQEEGQDPKVTIGFNDITLLEMYRESNQIQQAKECWQRLQHYMAAYAEPAQKALIYVAYVRVLLVEEEFSEARKLLDLAEEEFAKNVSFWSYAAPSIPMLRAAIELQENNTKDAYRWAEQNEARLLEEEPDFGSEDERLFLSRLYIKQGRYADAEAVLSVIVEQTHKLGRQLNYVRALLLRTELYYRRGSVELARRALIDALTVGRRAGFCRAFIDRWDVIESLMSSLGGVDPKLLSYVEAISEQAQMRWGAGESRAQNEENARLRESLTPRQIEMIWLINQGLKNYEIAEKLSIAPNTAKAHIRNLFDKLQVKSRTLALSKAREIGVFDVED